MLYLRKTRYEASPKAISRRTSYLRVRLEFLPYPQLMPTLFNGCGFGPPRDFTPASSWPWIDHYGFASAAHDLNRAIRTRFRYASTPKGLKLAINSNSPVHHSRGTQSALTPCGAIGLLRVVSTRFQVLFIPLQGVLFIFQSPYYALSVGR